eukprot:g1637.t1
MSSGVNSFVQGQGRIKDPYANMNNQQMRAQQQKLQNQQHETLDRVIGKLQETDKVADKIMTGLDDNTAAMKRILEKQDHIAENLKKGDKILGNMEGITGGGARADDKLQDMKLKPQSPEGYPVFQQGYVKKVGQHFNDKWSKKYAMLHGNKISIADDETGKFHQHITLTKNSFLMLFNDPKAPREVAAVAKDHPGGFSVFESKQQGVPWMFDSPTPQAQAAWVKGLQSQMVWSDPRVQAGSAKNIKARDKLVKGKKDDKYDNRANQQLDDVDDLLDVLDGKARQIGQKIDNQDQYIKKMQDNTTAARKDMHDQGNKMKGIMKESDKNWI